MSERSIAPSLARRRRFRDIVADPETLRASDEVDRTLVAWTKSLSPLERLRASSNATRALSRFRHASSETG